MPFRPFLAAMLLAGAAAATPVDFSFKPGTDLARVLETVAVMGKFNVMVLPGAGELRTSYSARLVEPLEALHLLAAAHGLAVKKVPSQAGGSETWVVGPFAEIRAHFPTDTETTVELRHASPEDVKRHVEMVPGLGLRAVAEPRQRKLFLRGPAEGMQRAIQLARELDQPPTTATLHLTLSAGAPGKAQTLWKAAHPLIAGEASKLKVEAPGKPAANGWVPKLVEGTFTANVHSDGTCTLKSEVEVVVENQSGAIRTVLAGTVQTTGAQDVLLGSHELGGDRALSLTARIELPKAAKQPADDPDDLLGGAAPASPSPSPAPAASPDPLDLSTPESKPSPSPSGTEIDVDL